MRITSIANDAVLSAFLAGPEREFDLLRFQYEEYGYGPVYRNTYTFEHILYLAKRLWGSLPEQRFNVTEFDEDCAIGTVQPVVMNDVVVELPEGNFLCMQLEIKDGILSVLRVLGVTAGPEQPLVPIKGWGIFWFKAKNVHYIEKSLVEEGKGFSKIVPIRNKKNYEHLLPPPIFENATPFQLYFLTLDNISIPIPFEWADRVFKLPLTIRRAHPPPLISELESLKLDRGIVLPTELQEFWAISDGCMFLHERIHGVYDILHFKKRYGREWENFHYKVGFLSLPLKIDANKRAVVVQVYKNSMDAPELATIRRIPPDPEASTNAWSSLRDYFDSEIKAAKMEMGKNINCVATQETVSWNIQRSGPQ